MKKFCTAFSLTMALLVPVYVSAQDHNDHRVYDRTHKDYHVWNDHEDKAYHMYWEQQHHAYIDWEHASARQRDAYWRWRHEHSDAVLKIEIR